MKVTDNIKAQFRRRKNKLAPCKEMKAVGGPFDGESIWLTTESTLVFNLGEWHGRYVHVGEKILTWENSDA